MKRWRKSPKGKLFAYKRDANKDGRVWTLSDEDAFVPIVKVAQPLNGIDRKNNYEGYNVLSCCTSCNTRKRQKKYEDFVKSIGK